MRSADDASQRSPKRVHPMPTTATRSLIPLIVLSSNYAATAAGSGVRLGMAFQ